MNNTLLKLEKEFEMRDNKKYKVEAIIDNMVYSKEANNHILRLYYLIL